MSQMGRFSINSGPGLPVFTITGNVGGAVSPDGGGNINLLGGIDLTVTGNPGTNTLTIDLDGNVADTYVTDVGDAVPVGNSLNVIGGDNITTSGAGSTITIDADDTLADTYTTDAGSAIPAAFTLNILGGAGITTSAAGNTVTIAQIGGAGVISITGDTGGAQSGALTLTGGTTGAAFGGAAGTITMTFAGITANGGMVNLGTDAADDAINIATNANAGRTVTIGNTTGTSDLDLRCGTGNFTLSSGTGTIINAANTGEINYPLQPAFCAYQNTNVNNVTGDGTVYSPAAFNTELFDQGSDFASNTFTAPVTGRYLFTFTIYMGDIAAGHTSMSASLVTSDNTFRMLQMNPAAVATGAFIQYTATVIAPLDVGDTALISLTVSGSTLTIDWSAAGVPPRAIFSGCLLA